MGGSDKDQKKDQQSGNGQEEGQEKKQKEKTSVWEWVVAAISTVLVLGAIGFMLYEALSEPASPPKITVQVDTIITTPTGYIVEFTAQNRGQTTAQGLQIEGELKSDTGTVQTSSVTLDYVPQEASSQGGIFFSKDPRNYRLELRPKGYDRP